jgi:hypothetical protein
MSEGAGQVRDAAGNIITPALRSVANLYVADLGAPAEASVTYYFSGDMANGPYALVETEPPDGLARNVTISTTAVDAADTPGTVLVTGLSVSGTNITETITPQQGSIVAGMKAFKSLTSVVGSDWEVDGGNDTIEIGFGNLVGLPSAIRETPAMASGDQVIGGFFGGAPSDPLTVTFDADEIEKCTVDGSAGTYDGSNRLQVLILR